MKLNPTAVCRGDGLGCGGPSAVFHLYEMMRSDGLWPLLMIECIEEGGGRREESLDFHRWSMRRLPTSRFLAAQTRHSDDFDDHSRRASYTRLRSRSGVQLTPRDLAPDSCPAPNRSSSCYHDVFAYHGILQA